MVKTTDFRLHRGPIPEPGPGQFLVKTMYLSLAPVMRMYMLDGAGFEKPLALGDVMRGRGVGRVIESNHEDFAVGDIVSGKLGWQEYALSDGSPYYMMYKVHQRVAPFSTAIGVLGVTGFTSYLGLVDIGKAKAGDAVLVTGAAGGVGSNVGQIARNLNCSPIVGLAGSDDKCRMLTETLGYHSAINYKTDNIDQRIGELFPGGIDVIFDNVAGPILDCALKHIKRHARVVGCGRISEYLQHSDERYAMRNFFMLGERCARFQGFFIYEMEDQFQRAEAMLARWIAQGKLSYAEDVMEGFETMPRALIRLYQGDNRGKQLVRVDPDAENYR